MSNLERPAMFSSLGIPDAQIQYLAAHLALAGEFVFSEDQEAGQTFGWLKDSLSSSLESQQAEALYGIATRNYIPEPPEYSEAGYDSCQSHRQLSKVVGEAILVGGLTYEIGLLGLSLSVEEVKALVGSNLDIGDDEIEELISVAVQHGGEQDFIFPGVSASEADTPTLEQSAYNTLSGKPDTSVRTVTGVGGLRYDRQWNHVTDLATFAKLKITDDKRYY